MKPQWIADVFNSQPLADFQGLSPDQMDRILYSRLEEIPDIFHLNPTFDSQLLSEVPVVKKLLLLIKLIGEAGEAKATQNGYLPRKMVNQLLDSRSVEMGRVQSEDYAPDVLALRCAVIDCGWLKKKSGRFSLTKKGKEIFKNGITQQYYLVLLRYWLRDYNWAFTDGHPACSIIQQAAVFLLYLLKRMERESISINELNQLFIRAFPTALEELSSGSEHSTQSPGEQIGHIVALRFAQRFAAYFGLVEYRVDKSLPYLEQKSAAQVKPTKLFNEVIFWFIPGSKEGELAIGMDEKGWVQ